MEIIITLTGSIILPAVVVIAIVRIKRKQQAKEAHDQELINTLEEIVEEKNKQQQLTQRV